MTLRRASLIVMLLTAQNALAAAVTVTPVQVKNGYFLAEECTPETDDPKLNSCICKAEINKAQVNNLDKNVATTINNQLSQVPEQLANESCAGKTTPVPESSILTNAASANYEVVYQSPKVLSVLVTYSTNNAGAAHPVPGSEGYTFDLTNGKTIEPYTLMTPEQLTKANEFAHQELVKKHGETMFNAGDAPNAPYLSDSGCENCTLYYTKDGWNMRFSVYAVAPYAAGEPTITIPTTVIPDPETLTGKKK